MRYINCKCNKKIPMRDTVKLLVLLGMSFLLVSLETVVKDSVPIPGLLAVMALGGIILKRYRVLAERLLNRHEKVWVAAELLLFVLVGAAVGIDLTYSRLLRKKGMSS